MLLSRDNHLLVTIPLEQNWNFIYTTNYSHLSFKTIYLFSSCSRVKCMDITVISYISKVLRATVVSCSLWESCVLGLGSATQLLWALDWSTLLPKILLQLITAQRRTWVRYSDVQFYVKLTGVKLMCKGYRTFEWDTGSCLPYY
jgi:hypothetical protein